MGMCSNKLKKQKRGYRDEKIVIACGAGLATSSMVKDKVEAILKQKGIAFQTVQCTLTEVDNYDGSVDLIITTMRVRKKYHSPVLSGSAYLSGVNEDEVTAKMLEILQG